MTSSISAAMSKNRRIPDGGQAVITSLSGFTAVCSSGGDPQAVVGLGLGERDAVALVGLEHEVGGGGLHPLDRRELLRHEVRDGPDVSPGDGAPQVVASRDQVDAAHLGEAGDALRHVVEADGAGGGDCDVDEGGDGLGDAVGPGRRGGAVPVDHRRVATDDPARLPLRHLRRHLLDRQPRHRRDRVVGQVRVALEQFQDLPHAPTLCDPIRPPARSVILRANVGHEPVTTGRGWFQQGNSPLPSGPMSTSPPYPGSGEPPRPDAGPPPEPGQYPGHPYTGHQYPGSPNPAGQYPGGGQYPGAQYPPGQYGGGQPAFPGAYAATDPLVATSFSDWWSKVIGVLSRSWQPLLIIQLATVVPGMLVAAVVTAAAGTDSTVVSVAGMIVGVIGSLILFVVALLAQGASVYVVGKQASGQEVGAGPALTFAAGRALPLLGWGLLAGILVTLGFLVLVLPGIYLLVVFGATLTGVIMFEREGLGRTFALVNPAFGQTLGRLLTFVLAALIYSAIAGTIITALVGPDGFVADLLRNILTLPVTFASVGVAVVTYATLRNRENPAVTTPALAAELDRP